MGKNATMMITPILQINGNDCDISLLNKPEVIVTMRSFIDDLPMSKTFDELDFSRKKDVAITFQVPPNLESIEVTLSGDVTNITKGICEKKTYTTSYSLNTHRGDTQYFETYLRRINNEYYFYLLGKSGEPVVGADIDRIKLQGLITGSKEYNEEFSTDKDGKVKLGNLGDICFIEISGKKDEKSFSTIYNLPYENEIIHYPYEIVYLEGEEIILPYPHKMFNSGNISLLRFDSNSNAIKNHFDNIVFQSKDGHEYGDICLKDLEAGRYTLNFKKTCKTITINIMKAVYWESEDYILKDNTLYEHKYKKAIKRVTH